MLLLATLSLVVLRLQRLVNALARLDRVVAALGHWLDLVDADSGHELTLTVWFVSFAAVHSHRVRRVLHRVKRLVAKAAVRLDSRLLVLHPHQALL